MPGREKAPGKQGRLALGLMQVDWVVLDGPGHLPFSQAGGALLPHSPPKLYESAGAIIAASLTCPGWGRAFIGAQLATALLDRLAHHRHVIGTGNGPFRFKQGGAIAKGRTKPGGFGTAFTGSRGHAPS